MKQLLDVIGEFENKADSNGLLSTEETKNISVRVANITEVWTFRVKLICRQFIWDASEKAFTADVNIVNMKDLMTKLRWAITSEEYLVTRAKASIAAREPLPLPNMEMLGSVACLQFDHAITGLLDNESELKQHKKNAEIVAKTIIDLANKVKQAADDINRLIQRKQHEEVATAEKEERKRQKEAEQKARQEVKKAKASAKAKGRVKAGAGIVAKVKQMPPLPPLMADLAKVAEMLSFDDETAMLAAKPKAGVPYLIKAIPERMVNLIAEKPVAACLGIWRIQAADKVTLQTEGRVQGPLLSDRRKRVTEILQSLAPNNVLDKVAHKLSKAFIDSLMTTNVYAGSHDMVGLGIERNGIGNIRCQTAGKRKVVCFSYDRLVQIGKKKSIDLEVHDEQTEIAWCE